MEYVFSRNAEIPSSLPSIIKISGSDTMLLLTRKWAEEYMRENHRVSVYTWGGGSAKGVEDLIGGKVHICAASRPLGAEEVRLLANRYDNVGVSFAVAKEALSIYVNSDNPVRDLSLQQLKLIFTGKLTNWKDVGGKDAPILVLRRSSSSGTYLYFLEHVLEEEPYTAKARVYRNTRGIVQEVIDNEYAIGFGGVAYGEELHCRVEGVLPTRKNIRDGAYPITRYLHFYTVGSPGGELKKFIDWVMAPDGQGLAEEAGYVPLW
jgi:phosphate transport system substrate-binding protein